jgi:hypothetical protein
MVAGIVAHTQEIPVFQHTKFNSKWIKGLNVRAQSARLVWQSLRVSEALELWVRQSLLRNDIKSANRKERDRLEFIKV